MDWDWNVYILAIKEGGWWISMSYKWEDDYKESDYFCSDESLFYECDYNIIGDTYLFIWVIGIFSLLIIFSSFSFNWSDIILTCFDSPTSS